MSLEAELAMLETLDLEGLRAAWRERHGDPPRLRSVDLVRRMLAWKLQVAALGGLDRPTRDALKRTTPMGTRGRLPVGSRVSREWKGFRHEVEVTAQGYRYGGETFQSLSTIATRIAGARWNGWRFFGLAEVGKAKGSAR